MKKLKIDKDNMKFVIDESKRYLHLASYIVNRKK